MRLPPYREGAGFTYAFGRFAVVEALTRRPSAVSVVLWHSALRADQLDAVLGAAAAAGVAPTQDDRAVERIRRHGSVRCLARVEVTPEALDPGAAHVLLAGPSHPGNVGTAMRSLAAFGFGDLAIVGGSVDPWGSYVVRASVGLRFALRCERFDALADYGARHGGRNYYAFDASGELELDGVSFEEPFTLLFGPEWSNGRSSRQDPGWGQGGGREVGDNAAAAWAGLPARPDVVRIPQAAGVESLNLAVAVSLATYRARR